MVQQIPFLCQNMVTIFVHFDDLTENDLTPENLKNNFSKKVDVVDLERKLPWPWSTWAVEGCIRFSLTCVERKKREDVCIWVFLFREERGMMGFDIVSFGFISYHVYSLGLELLFILSILLLYTTFFVLVYILILLLMSINLHGIVLPILILKVPCRWCMMLLESDFVLVSKLK